MPPNTLSLTFIIPSSLLTLKRFVSHFGHGRLSLESSLSPLALRKTRAVVNRGEFYAYPENDDVFGYEEEREREKKLERACEVYVCNLPRSFNAAHLLDMFRPYGTILSVEVCRNPETDESKGCGYVTLGSIYSARNAVAELDGSDVDGREMRVRFSVEMNSRRMNSSNKKMIYYEAPHKLYVGNLVKTVRPEELRNVFSRFGNIVSLRVLHDHKHGNNRVYAFLSFQSEAERDAAMSLNGKECFGRTLIVKEGVEKTQP
ncbi:31 kDa ribonucleoprotein, chloroplastic-like isoform X2 [Abrus precatorius]|uniref:31 kDa ribonucleoprotein, chloroplastic-like isoform X2 n=1 Tax=Abrus precatorius TaxID=3816 RepID=A0A8B8JYP0_ABRPR|nr:31 kDa ribonucleoprotein, chloroplastic-like isoform X2 [Abrus precatorius]